MTVRWLVFTAIMMAYYLSPGDTVGLFDHGVVVLSSMFIGFWLTAATARIKSHAGAVVSVPAATLLAFVVMVLLIIGGVFVVGLLIALFTGSPPRFQF